MPKKKKTNKAAESASPSATTTSKKKPAASRKTGPKPIRTYKAALAFIEDHVNYERRLPTRRDREPFTLARPRRLMEDLGDPQDSFKSVHIAGSKGKGSTVAMLARLLLDKSRRVGTFTSPHILDVRERITVDDVLISESQFTELVARVAEVTANYEPEATPTFFELLTAVAFLHFQRSEVDIAIVETGMGGRLDATNILSPIACAITNISLDHTQQLGDTVEKIAGEKAGIFKEGVPTIVAPQPDGVKQTLKAAAETTNTPLYFTGEDIGFSYRFEAAHGGGQQARICISTPTSRFDHLPVPLLGRHQAINCAVALGVLDQLRNHGIDIDDETATVSLAKVKLEGRMEIISERPRILVDGAHNAASIDAVMRAIGQNVPYDSMVVIFGCCVDKDVDGMLKHVLLGADKIIFTGIQSPRSATPKDLAGRMAEMSGKMAQVTENLAEAIETAKKAITQEDLICVTGSFFLVSEAKRLLASPQPALVK